MKTGTVTFHNSYNFGSALQAFALQRVQELLGYENEILNYIYDYDMKQYRIFRTHLYTTSFRSCISDLVFLPRNLSRKRKYEEFGKQHLKISLQKFHSSEEICKVKDNYDAFICGSDQIWNPYCTKKVVPAYFLEFASDSGKRRIAYAPSIAHSFIEDRYKEDFRSRLSNLDSISVREVSGVKLVGEMTDKPVVQVLDPTLLLDSTEYAGIMRPVVKPRQYIFFYGLEDNPAMLEYGIGLARETGLGVVYYSKRNIPAFKNGLNMYPYGPAEFLYLLNEAKYIVTNSFHATAFSIIFNKKFAAFTTRLSYSRIVDFLGLLGLQDRVCPGTLKIDEPVDYSGVMKKLKEEKAKSLDYLLTNLKEAEKVIKDKCHF